MSPELNLNLLSDGFIDNLIQDLRIANCVDGASSNFTKREMIQMFVRQNPQARRMISQLILKQIGLTRTDVVHCPIASFGNFNTTCMSNHHKSSIRKNTQAARIPKGPGSEVSHLSTSLIESSKPSFIIHPEECAAFSKSSPVRWLPDHCWNSMTDLQKNDFFQHISLSSKMTCPILFDPKCFGMLGQCMDRAVVGHGPRQILVLVGIHGNEPCGVEAAKLILQRQQVLCISDGAAAWGGITAQDLASARPCNKDEDCENESSLRWFPLAELYDKVTVEFLVGNPKALECNQRFLKRNLNRLFEVEKLCNDVEAEIEGYQYELQRARIVAESIQESNVILDIHSCSSDSPPFALPSSIDVSEELAASLPVKYVIESLVHNTAGGGTTLDFALSKQIPGVCVECGKHGKKILVRCFLHL